MLVLSRHRDETIVINHGEIKITVVEIRGDKCRLGIEAAADILVHRGEVEAAITRQAQAQPQSQPREQTS